MRTYFISLSALALGAAACGPGRTAAATQPTPAAFDASKSDPKALALVDAATTALGGYAKWVAVKQLKFDVQFTVDGQVKGMYSHAWDRWDGRHNFKMAELASAPGGDPTKASWDEVYYDQFDDSKPPHGSRDGKDLMREDLLKLREDAKKELGEQGYLLTAVYKLRDPGVILSIEGDVAETADACKGGCTRVKVAFDPAVGKDTWFVDYNKASGMPEIIEEQRAGEAGQIGYKIDGWNEAGGLKFPAKLENIGLKGEIIEFSNVAIGDVDEMLYVPSVTGAGGE